MVNKLLNFRCKKIYLILIISDKKLTYSYIYILVKNNFDYIEKIYIIKEVIFFVEYNVG